MNLLNDFEVGAVAAEIGVFEFPSGPTPLAATLAETSIGILGPGPIAIGLGVVQIHPQTTYVASDANYWQVQVFKRTGGGAGVLLAQGSSSVTLNNPITFTAFTATNMVLSTGNGSFISPGDTVTIVVTKVGTPAALQFYLAGFVKIN